MISFARHAAGNCRSDDHAVVPISTDIVGVPTIEFQCPSKPADAVDRTYWTLASYGEIGISVTMTVKTLRPTLKGAIYDHVLFPES